MLMQAWTSSCLHVEWEQYSDSASLPMSKRYRDELRAKLSKIDIESLNSEHRQKIERLKQMLSEDTSYSSASGTISSEFLLAVCLFTFVVGLSYFVYRWHGKIYYASNEELRRARDLKYQ
jgi:hypothetical protein